MNDLAPGNAQTMSLHYQLPDTIKSWKGGYVDEVLSSPLSPITVADPFFLCSNVFASHLYYGILGLYL